ncbi:hypothetical protein P7C73_g327, partial [Tremellales sp. Uapishka_1]
MLPSRLGKQLPRYTPICSSCRLRSSLTRLSRNFASPSSPRSRPPAAALAQEVDHAPYYQHHTPAPPLHRLSNNPYPGRNHASLMLPSPLPPDAVSAKVGEATTANAMLYPSTQLLDQLSLISICLRRPEHVPRAYQIFRRLLDESANGLRPVPESEVWGSVIEGVSRLEGENWKSRAEKLVWRWEESCGSPQGVPALAKNGVKVYQGWFRGLISRQSPLTPLAPYLSDPTLATSLLKNLNSTELPIAYEAILNLARVEAMDELEMTVRGIMGEEQKQREILSRIKIEEVMPVLEVAPHSCSFLRALLSLVTTQPPSKSRSKVAEASSGGNHARFAITNLRHALEELNSPTLALAHNRQLKLEDASKEAAAAELAHSAKQMDSRAGQTAAESRALQREKLQSWMHGWLGLLTTRLETDIEAMKKKQDAIPEDQRETAPQAWTSSSTMKDSYLVLYLTLLSPPKLALIVILEIMRMSGSGGISDGMKTLRGLVAVGKAVETEYRAETIKSVAGVDSSTWMKTLDPQTHKPDRKLVSNVWYHLGKRLESQEGSKLPLDEDLKSVWTAQWSQMAQVAVGSYLVDALLDVAKVQRTAVDPVTGESVTEEQPAFTHAYEYVRGKKLGVIKLNPVVATRLARDHITAVIPPKHLPMLVPPMKWVTHEEGGYLRHRVPVMRYKESVEQKSYLQQASMARHLEPVFAGLDVLSSTPWAINRNVFEVILQAWNSGDAIADIPAAEDKASYVMPEKPGPGETDPQKRSAYVERCKTVIQQQRKNHSERCKFNYNIEIARSFVNDTFYIPHNMDFRGRAYPIPPHLSPVGDDLCRGLLTFGEKKPLGELGLKWLQIHLANVFGFDKASFAERARFAQDHLEEIFDSVDRPLDGNRWWLKGEDQWQTLAACFELAAAMRSDDPTKYESSLPIHQDGTCNGMQHYAALGGDARGAKAVNLVNGDRPADIYTGVADLVNKVIEQDRAKGVPLALLINGTLGRKVVKQTVMTTVYGVTFVGARDQIAKQLVARGGIDPEHIYHVSAYIAKTVLGCIGELFSGAKAIQDWLTTCARLISRSIPPDRVEEASKQLAQRGSNPRRKTRIAKELMTSVIWTTPLGLPVVQPYRKAAKKQVLTALQTVYISDPNAPSEVAPQKQATAFPPNFIHSLDATHMLLTALKCRENKITFASVHDSYWTHASTVEPMSELIRDTFIHLHSQNLVGELRDEFIGRYKDHRIPIKNAQTISESSARKKLKGNTWAAKTDEQPEVDLEAEDSEIDTDEHNVGLSPADLQALQDAEIPSEKVGSQRFVRFEDVVPMPPPRGVFDVERIRDSAYFFS